MVSSGGIILPQVGAVPQLRFQGSSALWRIDDMRESRHGRVEMEYLTARPCACSRTLDR